MADQPKYEALSYVWGSPNASLSIEVNGCQFFVTKNLEAALKQFRPHSSTPRILWIDAICISQSDMNERTPQVQQMDAVYRGAKNVLVWLGRETNTSAHLFNHLDEATVLTKMAPIVLNSLAMLGFPFETEPYCVDCGNSGPVLSAEQIKTLKLEEKSTEALIVQKNTLQLPDHVSKLLKIDMLEALINFLDGHGGEGYGVAGGHFGQASDCSLWTAISLSGCSSVLYIHTCSAG